MHILETVPENENKKLSGILKYKQITWPQSVNLELRNKNKEDLSFKRTTKLK